MTARSKTLAQALKTTSAKAGTHAVAKPSLQKEVRTHKTSFFVLAAGRPQAGRLLKAHTHAAFTFLKFWERPVMKEALVALIGKRAVMNHIDEHHISDKGVKVELTAVGKVFFHSRQTEGQFDPAQADAYLAAITKGIANPKLGIKEGSLVKMQMVIH